MPYRNDALRRLKWATTTTEHVQTVLTTAFEATEIGEIVVVEVATPHRLLKITVAF